MSGLQRLRLDGVWHSVRWDDYGYYWLKNEESLVESSREPLWISGVNITERDGERWRGYEIAWNKKPDWAEGWSDKDFNKLTDILKKKADVEWGFWEDGINKVMGVRRMEDGTYKDLVKVEIDDNLPSDTEE